MRRHWCLYCWPWLFGCRKRISLDDGKSRGGVDDGEKLQRSRENSPRMTRSDREAVEPESQKWSALSETSSLWTNRFESCWWSWILACVHCFTLGALEYQFTIAGKEGSTSNGTVCFELIIGHQDRSHDVEFELFQNIAPASHDLHPGSGAQSLDWYHYHFPQMPRIPFLLCARDDFSLLRVRNMTATKPSTRMTA